MPEQLDETSEQVAGHFREARDLLSETERILAKDTTDQHRTQWPNVYRLESATQLAQRLLTWADPRITRQVIASELVDAARQTRDVIHEAVTTGGGSLIDAAEGLLKVIAQFGPQLPLSDGEANAALERLNEVQGEIDDAKSRIEEQISKIAVEIDGQKEQTFAAMEDAVEAVETRREAADQQASELGLVTSSIAAENLADAYAKDAKRTEGQASNYTWASLTVGILSVAVTAAGLLTVKESSSFETVLAHAAYGLPVALLAAYVNSLASTHRHEAWRLRHIELQIRTANPFLGLLDDVPRKETLAALALRFFPGQEGVSFDGKGSAELTPELIDLLRKVLQQQAASSANASSIPVGTAQTPDRPAES